MMGSIPADGWDDDERQTLARLEPQLRALRDRHADDPRIEVLQAARSGVLPEPLQAHTEEYLADSRWGRALVDGLDDVEVSLEQTDQWNLLKRIRRNMPSSGRSRVSWMWPALATAAALGVAVAWIVLRSAQPPTVIQPERSVAVATPQPPATYHLKLEKPAVKLSAAALTWRGSAEQNLLADLKPALDAFRSDDYETAQRDFTTLATKYPAVVEVFYYQGVSRLFLNDPQGAMRSFTQAASLADASFAPDIAWYRAVAEERAGRIEEARARLDPLCRAAGPRAAGACAALRELR